MAIEDYARPSVAVDIVLLTIREGHLQVLLIRRKNPPYPGYWACPGGFVDIDEGLEDAALRELAEETGVNSGVDLEQLHAFGDPRRDPRGRVISIAFLGFAEDSPTRPLAGDDAADVDWCLAYDPPPLAFDHDRILAYALQRLHEKATRAPSSVSLLPRQFSLEEIQRDLEIVLGEPLGASSLPGTLIDRGLIEPAPIDAPTEGRHAVRYQFRDPIATHLLSDGPALDAARP